ncbi:MAG: hypothetical protein CL580_07340 [Alteromonadaceae bacterium]|nr:hypothetical protein [Alteromonadaceae bacterium]
MLIVGLTGGIPSSVLQDGFAEVKARHRSAAALRHRRIEFRSVGIHFGQGSGFIGAEASNCEC